MGKLSPNTQCLIWVLVAAAFVMISVFPPFTAVAEVLRYFAVTIFGGVMTTKPGDAPAPLVDIVKKVAASLTPPPPPPPSNL